MPFAFFIQDASYLSLRPILLYSLTPCAKMDYTDNILCNNDVIAFD